MTHGDTTFTGGRRAVVRVLALGALTLAAGPALAACGGAAATGSGAAVARPAAAVTTVGQVVEMTDQNTYMPANLTIKKGTVVTWKNTGSMPHNVVSDAAIAIDKAHARVPNGVKPFVSPMLMGGGVWSYTFDTPGEFVYFCQPHEALGMVGHITVTD